MSRGGASVVRTFRVEPYIDGILLASKLLGGVKLIGGRIVRFLPARDPVLPWCYCDSVEIEGLGVFGSALPLGFTVLSAANGYENGAVLVATYKTQDTDQATIDQTGGTPGAEGDPSGGQSTDAQSEIDVATETYDFSIQQLTLPNDRYKWSSDTKLLLNTNIGAVKGIPKIDYMLSRHLVPRLPKTAIRDMLGRVNRYAFTVAGDMWPKETLRFDGASVNRKITNEGAKYYEIGYKLAIQSTYDKIESGIRDYVGWQRLFRPDTDRWETVTTAGGGKFLYEYDDDAPAQNGISGLKLLFDPRSI